MKARSWTAYALAGQSNARGSDDGGSVAGSALGAVHVVDREVGAYAPGVARDPDWWTGAGVPTRIGPGAGMARRFASRIQPGRGFRLCKYAIGGSTIAQWISTYAATHIATMSATGWAFSGLVWSQGEAEASLGGTTAAGYAADLTTLMGLYRATFPDLPVCVVKLASSFTGGVTEAEVRQGQEDFVAADGNATLLDMDSWVGAGQYDGIHWSTAAQFDCGERALTALEVL